VDIFAFGPVAAILDGAYALVTALSATLQPVAGELNGLCAVVVLTILIRILLVPVGISQVRAENTRRRIAPRLASVQRRYGTDRELLARKTMELYREEKASPFAGILPLLLQIPVISLVYAVFTHTTIAGHANALLTETAFGAPLGTSFVGMTSAGAAVWPAMLVYLAVLLLIAVATTISRRVLTLPQPPGQATPAGLLRTLSFLPYVTVIFAAFVPLAAAVYILASTCWTVGERFVVRRILDPERPTPPGGFEPSPLQ
jgi:YidC/Oxa1 family membrane protein insertase